MISVICLCYLLLALLAIVGGVAIHRRSAPLPVTPEQPVETPIAVGGMGHSFEAHR